MSLFATQPNPQTPPVTPPPETPPEETPPETEPEKATPEPETPEPPKEAVVRMPDGTEIPAKTYLGTHLEAQREILGSADAPPEPPVKETPTEPPAWRVDVDDETYQSDVEKAIAQSHNALGEEVTKELSEIKSEVSKALKQVTDIGKETETERAQRQIKEAEQTKGVTEAEMQAVYNEFGGEIKSISALAEIAASRKDATTQSEERTKTANEERKSEVSKVSGGGQAQSPGGGDQPKGRGLTGKERYSGAAIAAKYSAFSPLSS